MFKRGIWKGNVERREGRGRKGDKKREKGSGGTRRENRERDWFGLAHPQLLQPSELKCQICECQNTLGVQTSQAFMNPGPAVIWLHLLKRTQARAFSLSLIHTLNCVRNKFSFNPLNFGVVSYKGQWWLWHWLLSWHQCFFILITFDYSIKQILLMPKWCSRNLSQWYLKDYLFQSPVLSMWFMFA